MGSVSWGGHNYTFFTALMWFDMQKGSYSRRQMHCVVQDQPCTILQSEQMQHCLCECVYDSLHGLIAHIVPPDKTALVTD